MKQQASIPSLQPAQLTWECRGWLLVEKVLSDETPREVRKNRSCKKDDKLTLRSGSAGSSAFTVLVNESKTLSPSPFLRDGAKQNSWSIYPGEIIYISGSASWGPSMQDHQVFWVLIVSDESFHLFKQGKELSSVMWRHVDLLLLATYTRGIKEGKEFRRAKNTFSSVSDYI